MADATDPTDAGDLGGIDLGGLVGETGSDNPARDALLLQILQPNQRALPNPFAEIARPLAALLFHKQYQDMADRQRASLQLRRLLMAAQIQNLLARSSATTSKEARENKAQDTFTQLIEKFGGGAGGAAGVSGSSGGVGPGIGTRMNLEFGLGPSGITARLRPETTVSPEIAQAAASGNLQEAVGKVGGYAPSRTLGDIGRLGLGVQAQQTREAESADRQAARAAQQAYQEWHKGFLERQLGALQTHRRAMENISRAHLPAADMVRYQQAVQALGRMNTDIDKMRTQLENAALLTPEKAPEITRMINEQLSLRQKLIDKLNAVDLQISGGTRAPAGGGAAPPPGTRATGVEGVYEITPPPKKQPPPAPTSEY